MNELQIIGGVSCYEKNGTAYLRLEDVARGLGFTTVATSGNEVVRWNRVKSYLSDIGFPNKLGKEDYIPENISFLRRRCGSVVQKTSCIEHVHHRIQAVASAFGQARYSRRRVRKPVPRNRGKSYQVL